MKIYILEDEKNIQDYIKSILVKIPNVEIVGCTDNIKTASQEIVETSPDLILSDIQLKDDISFALFEKISIQNYHIIFITAFSHYAIRALNMGAIGYILKPFESKELLDAIKKIQENSGLFKIHENQLSISSEFLSIQRSTGKIVLKSSDFIQIVSFEDILYCEGEKGYTTFFLKNGSSVVVSRILKDYEDILQNERFIRCHQSFLVNMDHVTKYFKDGYLQIDNERKIPVSTRKKEIILKYFQVNY